MTDPYTQGYEDAINRGPKTQAGVRAIRELSETDYAEYVRGIRAGMAEIHRPRMTNADVQADLDYPIHTEFIAEDNA